MFNDLVYNFTRVQYILSALWFTAVQNQKAVSAYFLSI